MKKLFKKIICAGLVAAVLMSVLSFGSIYAIGYVIYEGADGQPEQPVYTSVASVDLG